MKTPAKLALFSAFALVLTACGGDKPAEPAKSAQAPATETKTEAPKAEVKEEPKAQETAPKTDEAPKEAPQSDTADTASKADDKAETKSEEPAKADAKSEVKALSIEEGKKRYEATCKVCHDQGLLEAPKLTDKADWAKRLEKGVDTLHAHSAKGFNKMPAQATGDVSEAEVYAAVDYMIAQVK